MFSVLPPKFGKANGESFTIFLFSVLVRLILAGGET